MNGQVFLDRKIWHALNEQCRGQGFAIVTSTEGAYFCRFLLSPCAREGDYQPYTETAEHRRVAGHHEDCAHDERLHSDTPSDVAGTRRQYVAALPKRDYTTKRVGMLFDNPTFQTINEGFGFADYLLGGYFTHWKAR